MSVIDKIFEIILLRSLKRFVEHKLLCVAGISLDLYKAFDLDDQKIQIPKLKYYGGLCRGFEDGRDLIFSSLVDFIC